jgi:hypothetical protein
MAEASPSNTDGKLDDLLASRRSLALDWEVLTELQVDRPKMPMELQVDRLRLPMRRYQLKEDRKSYKAK